MPHLRPLLASLLLSLSAAPLPAATPPPAPQINPPAAPSSAPAAAKPAASSPGDKVAPKKDSEQQDTTATLKVGDKLPDLTLKNIKNEDVRLADLYAKQPIVLIMYRGGWCPYCNTSLKQWQDKIETVTTLGAAVVAATPEKPEFIAETIGKDKLTYSVLSDTTGQNAKALGLAFTLDENTQRKYKGYGVDLSNRNASGEWQLPHPATLVIDTTGTIRYLATSEDYKQRAKPDDVIAAIKGITAITPKKTK